MQTTALFLLATVCLAAAAQPAPGHAVAPAADNTLAWGDRHVALLSARAAQSQAPPKVNAKFCTAMNDFMIRDGAPAQSINYTLCMDASTASYRREDESGVRIVNGTHTFRLAVLSTVPCVVCEGTIGPNGCMPFPVPPLQDMPFTMLYIDDSAVPDGKATINGVASNVWSATRSAQHNGNMFRPNETMHWFLAEAPDAATATAPVLLRGTCDILKQADYPWTTSASHDYTMYGKYTRQITPGEFAPPKGVACVAPSATTSPRQPQW